MAVVRMVMAQLSTPLVWTKIPTTTGCYPRYSSSTWTPLLSALQQMKKGKLTARDLVTPLETAIKLSGNAAAHHLMEHRRALLGYLNSELKSMVEDEFSDRGSLLFGKGFALKAKSTADNMKGYFPRTRRFFQEWRAAQKEIFPASGSPPILGPTAPDLWPHIFGVQPLGNPPPPPPPRTP